MNGDRLNFWQSTFNELKKHKIRQLFRKAQYMFLILGNIQSNHEGTCTITSSDLLTLAKTVLFYLHNP